MENKDIKRVFDKIEADENMKSRMLENIYNEKENIETNSTNKSNILNFKSKKLISILAASLVLIFAGVVTNKNDLDYSSSPSQSPAMEEGQDFNEFYNFDVENFKNNTKILQIKSSLDYQLISESTDLEYISALLELIEDSKIVHPSSEVLSTIDNHESSQNTLVVTFIANDYFTSSIKVYLDLNLIWMNGEYYEVDSEMIDMLKII